MPKEHGFYVNGDYIVPGKKMNEKHEIAILFDTYGDLLSEKKREILQMYFYEDYSLSEISEHTGLTRQGIQSAIQNSKLKLKNYEKNLQLVARSNEKQSDAAYIIKRLEAIAQEGIEVYDLIGRVKKFLE